MTNSEFLKGCRDLRKKGVPPEQWEYATKLGEACEIIDRLESKEQPPAGKLLPWQQSLLNDYDQRRFLELIERYNHELCGVWDKDFTINGERLLEIISFGWGATFSLDRSEGSRKELLEKADNFCKAWNNHASEVELHKAYFECEAAIKANKKGDSRRKERKL